MTTTRTTSATPRYADIVDYAEAITANGTHDAKVGRESWTTVTDADGTLFVTNAKTGGRCYSIVDLTGGDSRLIEAVRRTAAMRTR